MPNQTSDELSTCLECGATVAPAVDRVFPVGCEDVICMECALRRGGAYDENEDRWETNPRVDDLLVSVGASVGEARELMRRQGIQHLVVMDGARTIGVVSARDLGRKVPATESAWIEGVMSAPIVTADRDTTLRRAANLLRGHRVGCLPVIEDGKPVGIVTISDLLDVLGKGVNRTPPGASHWEEKHRGRRRSRHVPGR